MDVRGRSLCIGLLMRGNRGECYSFVSNKKQAMICSLF